MTEDGAAGADGPLQGTLEITVTHALILTFVVGALFGGFFMAAIGATGMPAAPTGDTSTGTGDQTGDTGDSRVQLSESFLADEPTLGDADAPLTIVEISDYGCPWCAEWAGVDAIPQRAIDSEDSFDQVVAEYVETGDARFIYKDYPVPQLHPNAPQAHVAANCALEQSADLYWAFHDALFAQRDAWTAGGAGNTTATFLDIAADNGGDADALRSCMESSDGSESQQDRQQVQAQVGSVGTPTFLIGTVDDGFVRVQGAQPYSSLKPIIDSELSN